MPTFSYKLLNVNIGSLTTEDSFTYTLRQHIYVIDISITTPGTTVLTKVYFFGWVSLLPNVSYWMSLLPSTHVNIPITDIR